jgi:hypothetical protein
VLRWREIKMGVEIERKIEKRRERKVKRAVEVEKEKEKERALRKNLYVGGYGLGKKGKY